ncbi:MAG: ketoacyl-ACP synthase III, partial [Phycisphaeraceae bacterium]|nr:ketoacyl-ACP synthase III [Phycisphaeraceae bacterium]
MNQPASGARDALRASSSFPVGVCLAGTGMALPQQVLTNAQLEGKVETSDEWIVQRTGIRQRYVCEKDVTVRDLARQAVQIAMDRAQVKPTDLDLLLFCTMTPEMWTPATAARLVDELGATPAGAVDISAACSGFVYGLNMAAGLIRSGFHRTVAVVGAEKMSEILDWNDRRTCVLFGDGAGAAVLTACEDARRGCLYQIMGSQGSGWRELYIPRNPQHIPPHDDGVFSGTYNTLQMNGREVFKFAVSTLRHTIEQVLAACNITIDDVAMIIPHQSNQRILEAARDKLKLPAEKLYINIDRFANT